MSEIQNDTSQSRSQDFMADVKNPMTEVYRSVSKQPYVSPTPGELPLIAIGHNPFPQDGDSLANAKAHGYNNLDTLDSVFLEKMKSVGFNAVQAIVGDDRNMKDSVDACNESGIKQIARMSEIRSPAINCTNGVIRVEDNDPKNEKGESYRHLNSTDDSGRLDDDVIAEDKKKTRRAHDIATTWQRNVEQLKDEEGCGGYQLCDEPSLRHFRWYAKFKDMMLEEHIDLPRSQQDQWGRQVLVNLLPLYANYISNSPSGMVGCEKGRYLSSDTSKGLLTVKGHTDAGYSTYLDEFENIFKPGVWCFDDYYLEEKLALTPTLRSNYFASLDAIRKQSLKSDRPFWATVRCKYHINSSCEYDPYFIPEEFAQLMGITMGIESRCALAGGAKGLMFWSVTRDEAENNDMNWAPIGFDFQHNMGSAIDPKAALVETPLYEYLVNILGELNDLGPLFMTSTVKATCVTRPMGEGFLHPEVLPVATTEEKELYRSRIASLWYGQRIVSIGTTGCFYVARHKTPSGGFLVCVNLDTKDSAEVVVRCYESRIKELTRCKYINPAVLDLSGMIEPQLVQDWDTSLTARRVGPGEWCIFQWKD